MGVKILNGITWGHSRGITPLLAGAQRFSELFPDVEMRWKKRSLQEFADAPLGELTKQYDLLIIDHPWSGYAAATKCLLPLDEHLPGDFVDDQAKNSVGYSHLSYNYGGHQWALAIDAATPATSYRSDLFEKNKVMVPDSWDELLEFAKSGRVLVPGVPVDTLMAFYMFCLAEGEEPFLSESTVIDMQTGLSALEDMNRLWSLCDKLIYRSNPITIAEIMSKTDDYWYCPFAYCYSNYSRKGFAKNVLTYRDLPLFGSYGRLSSTIGGTGIAVSSVSDHKEVALQFVQWITSGECQSTFYVENGGQPGHRSAWVSNNANLICNNFFSKLLPAMDRGYVRPRYNGYLHFQDHAGEPLLQYLMNKGSAKQALATMNLIYQESLKNQTSHD
jgi:multiple sugar transport system substrate-binding protein